MRERVRIQMSGPIEKKHPCSKRVADDSSTPGEGRFGATPICTDGCIIRPNHTTIGQLPIATTYFQGGATNIKKPTNLSLLTLSDIFGQ